MSFGHAAQAPLMTIAHSLPSFRGFQSLEFAGWVVGGKIPTIPGMYVLYLAAVEIFFLDWIAGGVSRARGSVSLYHQALSLLCTISPGTNAGPSYTGE